MDLKKRSINARQSAGEHNGAAALVFATDQADRDCLNAVFEASRWKLHFARDGFDVRAVLAAEFIPVVIIEDDAQAPSWRELLELISGLEASPAPKLIVVSGLVDERLWAEVLNLGGYDLLPKPLDADELAWVVRSALSERNGSSGSARPAGVVERSAWNGY
jgi:DNA-binding NtrC family response regulator